MLYVLTAADLGAVGPDTWTGWKAEVVTDLYHRTMQHLAGESGEHRPGRPVGQAPRVGPPAPGPRGGRPLVRPAVGRAARRLSQRHAAAADRRRSAALEGPRRRRGRGPRRLPARDGNRAVHHRHQRGHRPRHFPPAHRGPDQPGTGNPFGPDQHPGRRAGAGPLLGPSTRDYAGQPPRSGWSGSNARWSSRSRSAPARPPAFRRTWQAGGQQRPVAARRRRSASIPTTAPPSRFTIIDIFTADRPGLLYAITRTLFELGLSVGRAKIGTYLDQVVDVFYVTDQAGHKIRDEARLDEIRRRLQEVIQGLSESEA